MRATLRCRRKLTSFSLVTKATELQCSAFFAFGLITAFDDNAPRHRIASFGTSRPAFFAARKAIVCQTVTDISDSLVSGV
jgi:hypothetical protein